MTSLVGRYIRRLRRRSDYSQAQLAQRARISQAWVCRLETGDENPTLASLARVARALNVEVTELLATLSTVTQFSPLLVIENSPTPGCRIS